VAHSIFHLLTYLIAVAVGFAAGVGLAVAYFRSRAEMEAARQNAEWAGQLAVAREQSARMPEVIADCERLRKEGQELAMRLAGLEAQAAEERKGAAEKLALMEEARTRLTEAFHALSAEALRKNNQSFLELARETLGTYQEAAKGDLEKRQQAINEVVKPVRESLAKVDAQINELEKNRVGAYESLSAQVKSMLETQQQLRAETGNLVKALRAPNVRGRWGEVQLRRVVEMAGMVDHCDFYEQQSVTGEEGGMLRPDMLVRLPGEKTIVVDSKTPVAAYLDALEAPDDAKRAECLARHAAQVRTHVEALSRKGYWEQFDPTPEFVVLFLPGEMFFSAALERDPTLIEYGAEKRVILATPTTLIALLKAIYFGWRQQKLTKNAQEISKLGRSLYTRLSTMGGYMEKLGKSLGKSVESYNQAVASLETRVMVKARSFKDLEVDAPDVELETLEQVEVVPRQLQAPELTEGAEAELIRALEEKDEENSKFPVRQAQGTEPVEGGFRNSNEEESEVETE
jgi:DNA recombination protein RmuC